MTNEPVVAAFPDRNQNERKMRGRPVRFVGEVNHGGQFRRSELPAANRWHTDLVVVRRDTGAPW
jgi:hypothetical protein